MWIWFGLAALALIFEILTGTFFLLFIALGLAIAGLSAQIFHNLEHELFTCTMIIMLITMILFKIRSTEKNQIDRNNDVHIDIGQYVIVETWSKYRFSSIFYRGSKWKVELAEGYPCKNGLHKIIEVHDIHFIVVPK